MKREDDEKLWDLLGHSAEAKISPFFARNIARTIREARGESTPTRWWNLRWLVPSAGVAVALIAALSLRMQMPKSSHADSRPDAVALSEAQDNDLMTDLDDLVASDDGNSIEDGVLL
jgi:anti-sigma-K factor RskA